MGSKWKAIDSFKDRSVGIFEGGKGGKMLESFSKFLSAGFSFRTGCNEKTFGVHVQFVNKFFIQRILFLRDKISKLNGQKLFYQSTTQTRCEPGIFYLVGIKSMDWNRKFTI